MQFGYFDGNGDFTGNMTDRDPRVVKLCTTAFAAAWDRGIEHDRFRPAR